MEENNNPTGHYTDSYARGMGIATALLFGCLFALNVLAY